MASLANIIRQIAEPDAEAARAAAERLDSLVKPLGSLGRLELLAVQLASIRGKAPLKFPSKEILVMAADHGVWHEGVTPSPQVVTVIQAVNIVQGKAGVSVLARNAGAQVTLVDCGILGPDIPGTLNHKVAQGTGNIATGPAMTRQQAESLLVWSAERVIAKAESGLSLLAVGELGLRYIPAEELIEGHYAGAAANALRARAARASPCVVSMVASHSEIAWVRASRRTSSRVRSPMPRVGVLTARSYAASSLRLVINRR